MSLALPHDLYNIWHGAFVLYILGQYADKGVEEYMMFTEKSVFRKLISSMSTVLIIFLSVLASPYVHNTVKGDVADSSIQFLVQSGVFPLSESERLPAQIQRLSTVMFAYMSGGQRNRNKMSGGSFVAPSSLLSHAAILFSSIETYFYLNFDSFNSFSLILMKTVCKRE